MIDKLKRIVEFESAFSYKLIYIFRINDEAHDNKLKIGDATIHTNKDINDLHPNCDELNNAAKDRINEYTSTAGISYDLLHTELAIDESGKAFRDKKVHQVLLNSGFKRYYFDTDKSQNEWFSVNLDTAKNAIIAVKDGRQSLTNREISSKVDPIVLRPEQKEAVKKTIAQFKKGNRMLWNAKMRFGKTICALQVAKESAFEKTIILTHRPVVSTGWYDDFKKVFCDDGNYLFGSKTYGEPLDNLLKAGKKFVYFASIQDLRGSEEVGGKFSKNNLVFDTEWDFVVIDEAHEGTKTEKGVTTIEGVIKLDDNYPTKILNLSGTPFNLLSDFNSDEIYTWDYIMEQEAKMEWNLTHYGDYNPYEELPEMKIYTYDLDKMLPGYVEFTDKAFNFKEFFKVWTGDAAIDRRKLVDNSKIGKFVHEEDVKKFLDLLCVSDNNSNYPYSTSEYRDYFRHSLWMVPGVKEARALSRLLNEHSVFGSGAFNIINVAGNGDEETNYKDALQAVRNGIGKEPEKTYSITLSCGKLTTGVSVPEWTAVFMLAGSSSTAASNYLQTIFRVQTPANIGGKMKEKCYVFDFAPDRSLKMLSQAGRLSTKAGSVDDKTIMGKFLNFCPVISVTGSKMIKYDVDKMLQQLKRAYADRVVANGFDDTHIYNDNLTRLDLVELEKFENLKAIIGASKPTKKVENIDINNQGFTDEEYEKIKEIEKKKKRELTEEEKALLEERKKKREQAYTAMTILRGISIRIPLLIYGADVPIDKEINCDNFIDIIDDKSWKEFMPNGVTKEIFKDFSKYYDPDIFVEAGKRIRNNAKYADSLSPEERIKEISNIFSSFRNPDKETVLTPWRTVNMHMGDCIGGFNFYKDVKNDEFLLTSIENPIYISNGEVTQRVLNNNSKILEINSKTGLYPLYITYSLYRHKTINMDTKKITEEIEKAIWQEVIEDNLFVLCKTPMAKSITKRTLCGYNDYNTNIIYDEKMMEDIVKNQEKLVSRINNPSFWLKEGEKMNFDAIIGNPPYQLEGGSGGSNDSPMYQYFAELSKKLKPNYSSLIMPARWFAAGRENLLGDFRKEMLSNRQLSKLYVYTQSRDVFPNVEIKGGVCYYLLDSNHNGKCSYHIIHDGIHEEYDRNLDDFDVLIRDPIFAAIVKKVNDYKTSDDNVDSIISNDTPFGISSNVRNSKKNQIKVYSDETPDHNTKLYHIEKLVRKIEFVNRNDITKHAEDIDEYKVFIPGAGGSGNDPIVLGKPEFADKNSVCSQSYLYAKFPTSSEAKNFIKYIKTKFFRTLVAAIKISQSAPNRVYRFVPLQDFTDTSDINWNTNIDVIDQQLYKKYSISDEEINYIDEKIKYDEIEKYNSNEKIDVFIKRDGEILASGEYCNGKIKVYRDSHLVKEINTKSLLDMVIGERKSTDIKDFRFINDHTYENPSRAATVILGQNSNGYKEWKNKDDISLNDLLERRK